MVTFVNLSSLSAESEGRAIPQLSLNLFVAEIYCHLSGMIVLSKLISLP